MDDFSVYEYLWWDKDCNVFYRRKGYKKSRNMNRALKLWLYRNGYMIDKPKKVQKRYANVT